jgi:MOSC domain-containing protein YiiM
MMTHGCAATDINRNNEWKTESREGANQPLRSPFYSLKIMAHIFSLNRSNGGVPKLAVHSAKVTVDGMEGDWQEDRKHHGGPTRALCLFSLEQILTLQAEGHPIFPGSTGENVTISGLEWVTLKIGTKLRLGEAEIELTSFASPCDTIKESFSDERSVRISNKVNPGWSRLYARVLKEGNLKVGDQVEVLPVG